MDRLKGLPFYTFSTDNKYWQEYRKAYSNAVEAQQNVKRAENGSTVTPEQAEKFKKDLELWSDKAERLSFRAKTEEDSLEEAKGKNGLGLNINYWA